MRYCITGGSGFIGTYFCRALRARGEQVTILDLVEPTDRSNADRFVKGDVRNPAACRDAFAGCDCVIHLAAAHHDFGIERETYFSVNEQGTRVVCDALDETGARRVCFFSTVAIYGNAPEPHTEATVPQPQSPYGESKLAAERVLETWTRKGGGRRALVFRPTVTFGPENFANMYTLINQIARRRFLLVGRGENIKSLAYVENIVEATLAIWNRDDRPAFDVMNYIDKPDLTSLEIATEVYRALGRRPPRLRFPMWLVRVMATPFDAIIALTGRNLPISSARLKKIFADQTRFEADRLRDAGFTPPATLRQGIERMVEWYQRKGKNEKPVWHIPPREIAR